MHLNVWHYRAIVALLGAIIVNGTFADFDFGPHDVPVFLCLAFFATFDYLARREVRQQLERQPKPPTLHLLIKRKHGPYKDAN